MTLPGDGQAFAFIYSVEDPGGGGKNGGVGAQVRSAMMARDVDGLWQAH